MALVVLGSVLSGCGSSLSAIVGSTSTTQAVSASTSETSTTVPLSGEVAVAFPVVACTTVYGVPVSSRGWKPTILLAPIPTPLVGKVEFYTDGTHTLLGPVGWSCSQSAAAPGATGLVVFPSNDPNPPTSGAPPAGTEGVFATFATTGRTPGISLVCPYFTIPTWQQTEANCTGAKPAGEQTAMPTPDVASITDPSDVAGTLQGSGGVEPVTGVVIFPQAEPAVTNGSSVDVAEESCSLSDATLCPTVISDFEVREFPVPVATGG
ncbi:MAG TPA: hypothetical protein VHW93_09380 [Acidimicrobiales bacterium]|nr:hypothetical protein [Acidimicrobiales bacterium]